MKKLEAPVLLSHVGDSKCALKSEHSLARSEAQIKRHLVKDLKLTKVYVTPAAQKKVCG